MSETNTLDGLIKQIVQSAQIKTEGRGHRRFYVETRAGGVVYLAMNDALLQKLERGSAGIVETPKGVLSVIDAEGARRVAALNSEWVRAFNG